MVKSFHKLLNPAPCQCNHAHRLVKIHNFAFLQDAGIQTRDGFSKLLTQQCLEQGDAVSPYQYDKGCFGVIVSGACKVYRFVDDERYVIFDLLAAGDFFVYGPERGGRIDMFAFPDQIASLTTSCVLTMSRERFETLLGDDPAFGFALVSSLSTRLAAAHERQVQCLGLEAEQRIAFMLGHLLQKTGQSHSNPGLIPINLSRKDLASMAGLSLETASRILSEFERRGIISTGRAWVQIADEAALRGLARVEQL